MIAVRILAVIAWALVRMLILPLAALGYVVNVIVQEVLTPLAADMKKARRDAEKQCGRNSENLLVEANGDG